MIAIGRAPVRISFGGGGSDLPAYYDAHGGFVVSAAIDRCCAVIVSPSADDALGVNSADLRAWTRLDPRRPISPEGPLALPLAALAWFQRRGATLPAVDLFLASEVPPGSGLGSSSAMTAALVQAVATTLDWNLNPAETAEAACDVEIGILGRPIGKQDQYAASFGGLNAITFAADGVEVEPLALPPAVERALEARLRLYATGRTRDSAGILRRQRARTERGGAVVERLHALKALAHDMRDALESGDLDGFGALLDQGWRLKRGLAAGIADDQIDRWYALAREAGALGGKIAGAGGGGFLLLDAPPERQAAIDAALGRDGLQPLAFRFSHHGAAAMRPPAGEYALAASSAARLGGGR
jgi:D-glycero-alpha-D-manno-heptose-7-phosphate kinase